MKYFRMSNRITEHWNGVEPTGLYQESHDFYELNSGHKMYDYSSNPQGNPFQGPLICQLDDEEESNVFPTFYMSPAFIGKRNFYKDLLNFGVDNIDAHDVIIKDDDNNREINDYVLMNIIGRIICADLDKSDITHIDGIAIIDQLVIDSNKVQDLKLFLISEDTSCIVVNETIYNGLMELGYKDIHFEEVAITS